MFLQPRLKDLNSRSQSTSPFPSNVGKPGANYMSRALVSAGNQSDSESSRAHFGDSFGSGDMSLVSTGQYIFVSDVMLRHGLQGESFADQSSRAHFGGPFGSGDMSLVSPGQYIFVSDVMLRHGLQGESFADQSSRAHFGGPFGSGDMSLVSTGQYIFVSDVMLRHGLQEESFVDQSSRAHFGGPFGSGDMSLVSPGQYIFVSDVMLRYCLQGESFVDQSSRAHFGGSFGSGDMSLVSTGQGKSSGTSFQDASDGSSSLFSSRESLLHREFYQMQLYTKELEQKNVRLETQCTTLQYVFSSISHTCCVSLAGGHRHAYDSLLDVLQSKTACSTNVTAVPPIRSDYPLIKFWTKQEWTKYCSNDSDVTSTTDKTRGKTRAAQGVNVTMCFVEHKDGTVVDGHVASNIRQCARSAWVHLANNDKAPTKWRSASMLVIRSYHEELYRRFPFLQYCDNDWKAEQIAMDNYPSWYSSWCKKTNTATAIKDEAHEEEPPSVSTKRPNDAALDTETKRMKIIPQPASVTMQVDGTPAGLGQRSVAFGSSDSNFKVWVFHERIHTLKSFV
jgi:hypothetical protein